MAVHIETVRRLALALPGIEEGVCYGTPAFYVRRKMVVRLRDDHETLVVAFPKVEREALIDGRPDVFSVTDHYRNYDNVLLSLLAVDEGLLQEMIEAAWRFRAAKKTWPLKPSATEYALRLSLLSSEPV